MSRYGPKGFRYRPKVLIFNVKSAIASIATKVIDLYEMLEIEFEIEFEFELNL